MSKINKNKMLKLAELTFLDENYIF